MESKEIPTAENKIQGLAFVNMKIIHGVPRRKKNVLNVRVTIRLKATASWCWLLQ
jgi:hypothetical protein